MEARRREYMSVRPSGEASIWRNRRWQVILTATIRTDEGLSLGIVKLHAVTSSPGWCSFRGQGEVLLGGKVRKARCLLAVILDEASIVPLAEADDANATD